jgi:uncharacterized protein
VSGRHVVGQGTGVRLTRDEAIALLLHRQGLTTPGHARTMPVGTDDVLAAIRRMGVLQIDTIHVVARSPYLVLWARLGAVRPELLTDALEDRLVYEYWSHEASFLPVEHLPYSRVLMLQEDPNPRRVRYVQWLRDNTAVTAPILARAAAEGEVRSADFAREVPGSGQGWWDWKPEKRALEMLFMVGQLTVARRDQFHRVYRRFDDQFPEIDDAALPTEDAVADQHVRLAVRSLGVGTPAWVADVFRRPQRETQAAIRRLLATGELLPAEIEGVGPAVADRAAVDDVERVRAGELAPTGTNLLSPFDPVVWDRARALALFGFDYRIEVYTPGPKRRYGYFSMPILHGGRLVGRLDPKAHRAERRLEVRALHLEPGVPVEPDLLAGLATVLVRFAAWQGLETVEVAMSDPPVLRRRLGPALRLARREEKARRKATSTET